MVSNTITYTVKDLIDLGIIEKPLDGNHGGIHPKSSDYVEDGIPFIMASDLINGHVDIKGCKFISEEQAKSLKKGFAKEGDVLLSHKATIGRTAVVGKLSTDFIVLTPQITYYRVLDLTRLNPRYLKYYFDSEAFQALFEQWAGGGSTRLYLGITEQMKLPIELPEIKIQNKIVDLVDSFDRKVTLNRQINQTLEQMAQALFKSWFVDFDPVVDNALDAGFFEQVLDLPDELLRRAEARKAVRAQVGFKPLPAATRQLFPTAFEPCDEPSLGLGGWVPKGWQAGCVSDVARYNTKRIDTAELTLGSYISTENMLADRKGVQPAANLPTVNSVPAYTTGDILVSNIRPYFKKIWLAHGDGGYSNDVLGFGARNAGTECYLFNLIYQDSFFDFMMTTSKGSKMPRGDKKAIMGWPIVVPELKLRKFYSEKVKDFYTSAFSRHNENVVLAQLRDTLLPKLISGELSLGDVELTTQQGAA
ncbi:restriction endonuclease subunit S [Aeromonas dhakensis]|uniref:restriction endonuclease subunit S n=1 Tax=Aeromonas dhakensis TaxID=196024 RepID=UPI0039868172